MTFCKNLERKISNEIASARNAGTEDKDNIQALLLEDIDQEENAKTNQVMPLAGKA